MFPVFWKLFNIEAELCVTKKPTKKMSVLQVDYRGATAHIDIPVCRTRFDPFH